MIKWTRILLALSLFGFLAQSAQSAWAPSRRHIIFIADSHGVGTFGKTINDKLRSLPETTFNFVASGGSAPFQWVRNIFTTPCGFQDSSMLATEPAHACGSLRTPTLASLVANAPQGVPTTVIIAQGTNYSFKDQDREFEVRSSANLIKAVPAGAACIWVGPPNMRKFANDLPSAYEIIKDAIQLASQETAHAPCTLIDSRLLSEYPTGAPGLDGVHYGYPGGGNSVGKPAAKDWATKLIQTLGY